MSEKALDKLVEEHGFTVTGTDEDGNCENPDADIVEFTEEYDWKDESGEPYTKRFYHLQNRYAKEMRTHSAVIQVVEELGDEASDEYADLEIVEVPDDVEWTIEEYDGIETVEEKHQSWP